MLLTLITFLIILSILVLVHELGHFFAAKKAGIKVEEFGFGFPPKVWSRKIGETLYSLNLLPIGGFVKLYGEDALAQEGKEAAGREKAFFAKSKKARLAVIVAGVTMNLFLAITIFSIIYVKNGIPVETDRVKILEVMPDSAAQKGGLLKNDIIIKAHDQLIKDTESFIKITSQYAGKELLIEISRNEEIKTLIVVPNQNPPADQGPLGVIISQTELKFYSLPVQIFRGIQEGFKESFNWIKIIIFSLKDTLVPLITQGKAPKDVAGPVGIFQVTGVVSQGGILPTVQFLAILSVNLAIMNILPLPALDGGRLLFLMIEAITKKRVKPELEAKIHSLGMAFLLGLILLITINDLIRIFNISF